MTAPDHSPRIVFAGVGQMGFHLAQHVHAAAHAQGATLEAFDTDQVALARIAAEGISTIAELPNTLGRGDVLCLSLPDGRIVRAVLAALGSLEHAAGLTVLDFSSVAPADARAIASELAESDVRYIDSPVTGGVIGAEMGNLTTIVGAEESTLGTLRWVPDAFSARVVFTGAIGTGALLKSLNNMVGNIAGIAAMEGLIVARRAGISDDAVLEVFNNGTALTYFSQVRYPKYVVTRRFDAGMKVGLVNKDLQIALDAAQEMGCDIGLSKAGREMWATALEHLGPQADTTMMMDVVAKATTGEGIVELLDAAG